jgi:integrase
VALSPAAVELLKATPYWAMTDLIFPGTGGEMMSDATLAAICKKMHASAEKAGGGWVDPASGRPVTPHGFRSSFRVYAAERTEYPYEMAEMALAHTVGTAVERAYNRTDMLEKRRSMMADWAGFIG